MEIAGLHQKRLRQPGCVEKATRYFFKRYKDEHLRFPEVTVEAETGFRQVTGQVLWADAMMATTDIAFDIGDKGLDSSAFATSFPEPGTSHL